MKTVFLTVLMLSLSSGPLLADKKTDERLANAAKAFDEIMSAPDKGIPGTVLNKAECIAIVPGMTKGGFIVGGSFGRGAFSCRGKDKSGWGAPVMIELGGGSVGFQIGAEATDVVMLIMNREGIDSLLKSKFTLGGEASVAGGPVGPRDHCRNRRRHEGEDPELLAEPRTLCGDRAEGRDPAPRRGRQQSRVREADERG